jgi:hypothetical protein
MADRQLLTGGATDWGLAGNWSGDGGAKVPVTTDLAVIATGTQNVVTGVDQTGDDLGGVVMSAGFSGDLGASGGRLILAADLVAHYGTGKLWLYAEDNALALKVDRVLVCCGLGGEADIDGDAGALTLAECLRGTATFGRSPTTLVVGYKTNRSSDVTCTVQAGAGTVTTAHFFGGTITTNDAITTANFSGGRWTHAVGAITTLNAMAPGTVTLNASETVTTANVGNGGVLDLMADHTTKTITTLNIYPDGNVLYDDAAADTDPSKWHNIGTINDMRTRGRS